MPEAAAQPCLALAHLLKSQILIIASFFLLLALLAVAAMWIPEAKSAIPFIAGAFGSELAHLARRSTD